MKSRLLVKTINVLSIFIAAVTQCSNMSEFMTTSPAYADLAFSGLLAFLEFSVFHLSTELFSDTQVIYNLVY